MSALVFPGLGHVVLKHYRRGFVVMLAVLACLVVIVTEAAKKAVAIMDHVQYEGGAIDMATVSEAARQASVGSDSRVIDLALLLMVLCWVFAIVDAYRIGKRIDEEGNPPDLL
jgi:hypothetical protein